MLAMGQGDAAQAEECFAESLRIAREQQARMLELRTAASYSRQLTRRGEGAAAYELLTPVYDRFTEGFNSPDLVDARSELDALEMHFGKV
jgi:hypothetical protein